MTSEPKKRTRLTHFVMETTAFVVLTFPMAVLTFAIWASAYHQQQIARQYRDGPWEISTIRSVEKLQGRGRTRFLGKVDFANVVAGQKRAYTATVYLGRCDPHLAVGGKLRIAPHPGSCAEVATAYD